MTLALRLLLIAILVYVPNQTQFPAEFEVKGFNIINTLMLLTLFVAWLQRDQLRALSAGSPPVATPLAGSFKFIFAVLVLSYCIGQMYDSSEWANDLTALKNIILFMLIYFLFFHSVRDLKTIRLMFVVILFVTFVASFQGLRQALDYGIAAYNDTRRVAAPFGWSYTNANRSAVFFTIFLPLFASLGLFYKGSRWVRGVAFACLGLGIFVIFFTYSRQAYFIVALLALLLTLRKSFFIAALVAVALATFPYWAPETAVARLESTTQGEQTTSSSAPPKEGEPEGKYDESTESRFIIWEGAAQLIAERPWGNRPSITSSAKSAPMRRATRHGRAQQLRAVHHRGGHSGHDLDAQSADRPDPARPPRREERHHRARTHSRRGLHVCLHRGLPGQHLRQPLLRRRRDGQLLGARSARGALLRASARSARSCAEPSDRAAQPRRARRPCAHARPGAAQFVVTH